MSGMHLLAVYYTTTNHKKRRKKPRKMSKSMEASLREHEKFLKRMGVSSNPIVRKEPSPLKLDRAVKQLPEKNINDMDWSPCLKKNTPTLSGDYIIGQAYNKGNLQVLSKSDSADASTGKRR